MLVRSRRIVLLAAFAALCAVPAACESSDEATPSPTTDSGTTPTPTTTSTTPPPNDGAAPKDDGAAVITPDSFIGCRRLLGESPNTTSGIHSIDLDGTGPLPAIDVYCDMTFDGGGWTLIQSYSGLEGPGGFPDFGDAGPADSGVLVAAPQPKTFGALAGWVVKMLAAKSSQVHIRYSFAVDAGAADPDAGLWVTSRPPPSPTSPATLPIQNLRDLHVLTYATDGGFGDWGGPQATQKKLGWNGGACVDNTYYPSVYWACANPEAMGITRFAGGGGKARWLWGSSADDPMEVYVR